MEKEVYKRATEEIICENPKCVKSFLKVLSEIKRTNKKGGKHFCSLSCSGKVNHRKNIDPKIAKDNLLIGYNKSDKYTGLREHLRRAKYRNQDVDITLDDLLEQWDNQAGVCPYSGVNLIHPIRMKDEGLIYMASLDRVDSNIGYMKGNIQFISAVANMAKNNMTHEQMVEFCKLICFKWKKV